MLAPRTTCRGVRWTSQCAQVLVLLLQAVADAGSAPLQKIPLTGWLLAVLLITLPAGADDLEPGLLKVCIADGDIPPFTAVKSETQVQSSIRQAAAVQGWRVEYILAVDLEPRVRHLLAQPAFAGRFEILPEPVGETFGYLAVSPDFYARHGAEVEQLWTEIGRLNRTRTQR